MKNILLIFSILIYSNGYSQSKDDILGVWLTDTKKSKVEIYKINDQYLGRIIWMKQPLDSNGKKRKDSKNPNIQLRKREILGVDIFERI